MGPPDAQALTRPTLQMPAPLGRLPAAGYPRPTLTPVTMESGHLVASGKQACEQRLPSSQGRRRL
eukprot:CAMPEP_0197923144 /NCGR_PEP_ID=MMETSP1439-20131203/93480_1 /TAXON_ID=66791 /ORGANISM="Gonyaulax spinifera, Strain CCMP409" /LENGTH=64 /DNA_ID=CAMNT_0043545493 /DNA_START=50 /DNA_END=241 /DNA_ORIENTATION=-